MSMYPLSLVYLFRNAFIIVRYFILYTLINFPASLPFSSEYASVEFWSEVGAINSFLDINPKPQ